MRLFKVIIQLLFLLQVLSCGQDDTTDIVDDPVEEEENPDPVVTINENVWVDPTIIGDEHEDLLVHVWFVEQLVAFDDLYTAKTATYNIGRIALRDQLIQELKDMNEASMALAKNAIDSLVEIEVIHSVEEGWIVNGFRCRINAGGIVALSHVPGVHSIFNSFVPSNEPVPGGRSFYTPSGSAFSFDPDQEQATWHIDSLGVPRVWTELGITGKGAKNIIHDFGFSFDVDAISESLYVNPGETPDNNIDDDGNGYIDDYHGYNFEHKTAAVNVGSPNNKGSIHGNSVATIICGGKVNGTVYGVAPDSKWAAVMGLVTFSENIEWAIEMGFDTYTMSFSVIGLNNQRGYWRKISEHAALCGLFLISGAGNNGLSAMPQIRTPEDIPYALFAVSGTDKFGNIPASSSNGPVTWDTHHYQDGEVTKPDFATFNNDIQSIDSNGNAPISLNGNSFAGPHLAGIISLMLEADPDLNVWEVREILVNTADDIHTDGVDAKTGHGQVNAFEAVKAAQE